MPATPNSSPSDASRGESSASNARQKEGHWSEETKRTFERNLRPLAVMRRLLEVRVEHDKPDDPDLKECLALLNRFEKEGAIRMYIRENMVFCQLHGLCTHETCKRCEDFDCWVGGVEQSAEYCMYREEWE